MAALYDMPAWRVTLNGRDLTGIFAPRLISLTITECRSEELDQLDISLSDHDGLLELPSKDAELSVSIGWRQSGLVDKGRYLVDEIEHTGAPDTLTLRARSADLLSAMRVRTDRSYHEKTIEEIVGLIASENGLQARVGESVASTLIDHIDQTESDLAFLNRLGAQYDQVATVKSGYLLFLSANESKSYSGQTLPTAIINRSEGDSHRYHEAGRDAYSGVRAYWHDPARAQRRSVLAGQSGNAKRLRDTFASEQDALAAATAEWQRIQRGVATMSYTLAKGRPDLSPQQPVQLTGFKPQISSISWLIKRVEHALDDGGLRTRVELETQGADDASEDAF